MKLYENFLYTLAAAAAVNAANAASASANAASVTTDEATNGATNEATNEPIPHATVPDTTVPESSAFLPDVLAKRHIDRQESKEQRLRGKSGLRGEAPIGRVLKPAAGDNCASVCGDNRPLIDPRENLQSLIRDCINYSICPEDEDRIGCWDTSQVTDMSHAFKDQPDFNDSLHCWDVSSVETMYYMFYEATSFDQNISGWETSQVTTMKRMFYKATSFDQDISGWDTSHVENMYDMFRKASSFNQCLSSWAYRVPSNCSTKHMLAQSGCRYDHSYVGDETWCQGDSDGCYKWKPVAGDDCARVCGDNRPLIHSGANMKDLIEDCLSGVNCPEGEDRIGCWDTSQVTNMASAFKDQLEFNDSLHCWDVSSVENMFAMFNTATSFNQALNEWNTGKVTQMNYMFVHATSFDQCLSSWTSRTQGICNTKGMFLHSGCPNQNTNGKTWCQGDSDGCYWYNSGRKPVAGDNCAIVCGDNRPLIDPNENLQNLIKECILNSNCPGNEDRIGCWDTSQVKDMTNAFASQRNFNDSLHCWDVSSVESMHGMFSKATSFNQALNGWDTLQVDTMRDMFSGATSFDQDLDGWNTLKVTDMRDMFRRAASFNQDISGWDTSQVTTMLRMFYEATSFNQCLSSWAHRVPSNCSTKDMFRQTGCPNGDQSYAGVGPWCQGYSNGCYNAGRKPVARDNCSSVCGDNRPMIAANANMHKLIKNCISNSGNCPEDEDRIGCWDTSQVKSMVKAFQDQSEFNDSLHCWDVSSVGTMYRMFEKARAFNQDLKGWDTSQVEDMPNVFEDATSFNGDISAWNTSQVKFSMHAMFKRATSFDQDISGWDTSQVRDMGKMFYYAVSFNQDISGWDTSQLKGDYSKKYTFYGSGCPITNTDGDSWCF